MTVLCWRLHFTVQVDENISTGTLFTSHHIKMQWKQKGTSMVAVLVPVLNSRGSILSLSNPWKEVKMENSGVWCQSIQKPLPLCPSPSGQTGKAESRLFLIDIYFCLRPVQTAQFLPLAVFPGKKT